MWDSHIKDKVPRWVHHRGLDVKQPNPLLVSLQGGGFLQQMGKVKMGNSVVLKKVIKK